MNEYGDIDQALGIASSNNKAPMKIKEATFSLSQVIPMGEFKNVKPMLSVTFEGEEISFDAGWAIVELQLKKEVARLQQAPIQSSNMPRLSPNPHVNAVDAGTSGTPGRSNWTGEKCNICGTPKIMSRNNKLYCPNKCWLKPQS